MISIESRLPTVKEYQLLRASTDWESLDDETVRLGLRHSLFAGCALSENKIVGMGRVIGDGAMYFYIQDVIVLPAYKRMGIGTQIMMHIETFLAQKAFPGTFIGLMAAEGVAGFYKKFQYLERPPTRPGMFKMFPREEKAH